MASQLLPAAINFAGSLVITARMPNFWRRTTHLGLSAVQKVTGIWASATIDATQVCVQVGMIVTGMLGEYKNVRGTQSLPLSGAIGLLPTYENHTNRYVGPDGVLRLRTILEKWVGEAPYTIHQIRVAVIDPPDIPLTLREISRFLAKYGDAKVIFDAYF